MPLISKDAMVIKSNKWQRVEQNYNSAKPYFSFLILNQTGPKPQECWSYKNMNIECRAPCLSNLTVPERVQLGGRNYKAI